ncbi:MAG: peptidylprolyl isomerase [Eubacteriales bacterium]|nr:peptidylprolyl isomerase [Eubacteriales bacterium]MDD4323462.1 peptidylprolyl isomerase [Eubacteriales bacterium]MDD4540834.1 peptidylprolyl isomerase [Eubacteriales bacterium]
MDLQVAAGFKKAAEATNLVNILMDSGKSIVIELDEKAAPISVANFQKLVSESFYDGIIFHRIIPGFMIQGGDPQGTGIGGSDMKIKGEFKSNGVDNRLSHLRGVVSMARTQVPDSASSQFFICHEDSTFLDGEYAAFGKVVAGMDEVDRIARLKTNRNDFPDSPPVMKHVFFVVQEEA